MWFFFIVAVSSGNLTWDYFLFIRKENYKKDGLIDVTLWANIGNTRTSYGDAERRKQRGVSPDRFFCTFFVTSVSGDRTTCTFQNNAEFFWNRVDRERIFGTSGEPTCNSDPAVLGGPDRERAVFLRAVYPLAIKALINQPINHDLISDQKSRDRWSISLLLRIRVCMFKMRLF